MVDPPECPESGLVRGHDLDNLKSDWASQWVNLIYYWQKVNFGLEDGGYGHLGAGAGAGGHLGGVASIRSSSGGQDEAIDTPSTLLPSLQGQIPHYKPAM